LDRTVQWGTVANKLSMGFITGMKIVDAFYLYSWDPSGSGVWCDHPGISTKCGWLFRTMSRELELVASRLFDSPGCAASANP
jgi:hypothetical protein